MNILAKILDDQEMEVIYEIYDEEYINKINNNHFLTIIQYLINNKIPFIKDIIIQYLGLFDLDPNDFILKFENIKKQYGECYIDIIGNNMSLLERMYY